MSKYLIPVNQIEDLEKKIKSIKNKGAKIVFEIGKEVVKDYSPKVGPKMGIRCFEVEVEGEYKINDWTFVGTIQHNSSGNIIRSIGNSYEGLIPTKYRTSSPECEHCHRIRDRKDTYLVYNEKTKEFKQVGRNCLMGYTNGISAEFCASLVDVFAYISKLENPQDEQFKDEFMSMFMRGASGSKELDTKEIKPIIFGYVKKFGYISKETARTLVQIIFSAEKNPTKEATADEIKEMDDWVKSVDTSKSDYMWNAQVAWTKNYSTYRDIALLASFVSTFLKDKIEREKRAGANNNEYVGNIGDKITITDIKDVRVLYVKDGGRYSYYADDTSVYEIIDGKGHTFIWATTADINFDSGRGVYEISATVKSHKEYKGTKQTVVTRGKVISWRVRNSRTNEITIKTTDELLKKTESTQMGVKEAFNFLSEIFD